MQSLSHAVPGAIAELLRGTPLSPGKVQFAWTVAVGPAMQRATAVKLVDDGRLLVDAVDAQWAREVRRSTRVILPRLRALLGDGVVTVVEVRAPRR